MDQLFQGICDKTSFKKFEKRNYKILDLGWLRSSDAWKILVYFRIFVKMEKFFTLLFVNLLISLNLF